MEYYTDIMDIGQNDASNQNKLNEVGSHILCTTLRPPTGVCDEITYP